MQSDTLYVMVIYMLVTDTFVFACVGYFENPPDHSALPAGGSTARPELPPAAVLWDPPRQRATEQVRDFGVMSPGSTTGT